MPAYNLGSIRNGLKRLLLEDSYYTDAVLDEAINEGIDDLIVFSVFNKDVDEATLQAGLAEHALPSDFLYLHGISWDGRRLTEMTLDEWMNTGGEQNTGQGDPRKFMVRNNEFVTLYPTPGRAAICRIFYTSKPDDLVEDDEVPIIPRQYSSSIKDFAMMWLLKGDNRLADAEVWEKNYLRDRALASSQLNRNNKRKVRYIVR